MAGPQNPWLERPSASVPRKERNSWQMAYLAIECVVIVALLIGIAVVGYNLYQSVLSQNLFPLKRVVIREPLHYGDMHEVSEIIRNHQQRDLMHMDIAVLAEEMQQLDWIAKASVYKRWPDTVEMDLVERVPVVRWGEKAFLDADGAAFTIPDNDKLRHLFTVHGPDGYEKQVLGYYQLIAPWLSKQRIAIQELYLDQRLVWHARLENGLDVILGRDQLNERLKKLIVVNDKVIEPYARYIDGIDLRYHDGFSVRWKAGVKPVTAEKNPERGGEKSVVKATVAAAPVEKPKTATKAANKAVAKDVVKDVAKETAKPAAKETPVSKAVAKETAKPVAKENPASKTAAKESAKPAAKETAAAKPAAAKTENKEKVASKENKEKTTAKPASAPKESGKENKEKAVAKPAVATKENSKESSKENNKEKSANKNNPPAKEKAAAKTTNPTKENKEKPATSKTPAKEKGAEKTSAPDKNTAKENKTPVTPKKTTETNKEKAAPAKAAPKEKETGKNKK